MLAKLDINIRKSLAEFDLNIAQSLPMKGITAIFGPSGSGKTTLLRIIAGFETQDSGRITLNEKPLDMPVCKRSIGYMFQDGRLFDHLKVSGNLAFADKRSAKKNTKYGLEDIVEAFDLRTLLTRRVSSLSGGERQRVGLARTLLTRPKLLLLDEPLAALDRGRKREILPFLEILPKRFGVPCLYVSHDIEEVSRLADHILVLAKGKAEAYGSAVDIIGRLDLEPLTGGYEASTLITGTVSLQDTRLSLTHITFANTSISMPLSDRLAVGDTVRLRIRASDVAIATRRPNGLSIRNIFKGTIDEITQDGESVFADIAINVGAAHLRSRITRASIEDLQLKKGQIVFALVKSMSFEGRFI